jgi:hypothetical protein
VISNFSGLIYLVFLLLIVTKTYSGARLSQTLDWALSSVGDDITAFISKLTDMEKRLYQQAASTAASHQTWKLYRDRRWIPRQHAVTKRSNRSKSARTVSPFDDDRQISERSDKRARASR